MQPFITPHRAAGAILLLAVGLSLLLSRGINYVQAGLGLLLLLVQEQAKSDLVRLLVFGWVLFAIVANVVSGIAQGVWAPILPVLLIGGGLVGLMLEGLKENQIYLYSAIALAGIFLSLLLA